MSSLKLPHKIKIFFNFEFQVFFSLLFYSFLVGQRGWVGGYPASHHHLFLVGVFQVKTRNLKKISFVIWFGQDLNYTFVLLLLLFVFGFLVPVCHAMSWHWLKPTATTSATIIANVTVAKCRPKSYRDLFALEKKKLTFGVWTVPLLLSKNIII